MKTIIKIIPIMLMLMLVLSGCGNKKYQAVDVCMGTIVSVSLEGKDETATNEVIELVNDLEKNMLSYRLEGSEVYKINHSGGEGIKTSEEMLDTLMLCRQVSEKTEGAFDISLLPLVRLWDIDSKALANDGSFVPPDKEQIEEKLLNSGYNKYKIENGRVFVESEDLLDLGAVGKGLALGKIRDYLSQNEGVENAIISLGGSILTYGSKADKQSWRVAIVDPFDDGKSLGYVEVQGDNFISTSGDYERFTVFEGEKYHHILDPKTGYPAKSDLAAVTIVAEDGLMSDILSTACFVLGYEESIKLLEDYQAEAVFVLTSGEIKCSDGIKDNFHKTE